MGDPLSNESEASRGRRRRRYARQGRRDGNFFALTRKHGRLQPGVYERIVTGFGSAVRSVLHFVRAVQYRPRFHIFDMARKVYDRRFPQNFEIELAKAVRSSWERRMR